MKFSAFYFAKLRSTFEWICLCFLDLDTGYRFRWPRECPQVYVQHKIMEQAVWASSTGCLHEQLNVQHKINHSFCSSAYFWKNPPRYKHAVKAYVSIPVSSTSLNFSFRMQVSKLQQANPSSLKSKFNSEILTKTDHRLRLVEIMTFWWQLYQSPRIMELPLFSGANLLLRIPFGPIWDEKVPRAISSCADRSSQRRTKALQNCHLTMQVMEPV